MSFNVARFLFSFLAYNVILGKFYCVFYGEFMYRSREYTIIM